MLVVAQHASLEIARLVEPVLELLPHHPAYRVVDHRLRDVPIVHRGEECFAVDPSDRHVEIEAIHGRAEGRVHSEDEVGQNEPVKPPVGLQDLLQQMFVFAAKLSVDGVVGAHDRGGAAFEHRCPEMRKVDLAQGSLIDSDVDFEASVLDAVRRVVFRIRKHVLLHSPNERDCHPR